MTFAPAIGLGFALLAEFLEWLLISALIIVWAWTLGWLLVQIANRLHFTIHIPHVWDHTFDLGGPFRSAEAIIRELMLDHQRGLEIEIGWTWNQLRSVWHGTALAVEWLAKETDATFDWLASVRLPKWAKWAAAAALPAALLAKIVAAVVARIHPVINKGTTVVTHTFPTKVVTIVQKMAAGAATVPGWVIHIPRELRDIKAEIRGLRRSLRHPATFLGAAVMAGLIANVLGIATRCVRRGNVGKAARRICGMDANLFESLLADGLAIVGVISVVEFAEAMLAIEDEAVAILGAGIREFPGS